jgi:hypothetical protein
MNIFLINENPVISAEMLFKRDPLRANKQIVECCQLLAFYDITTYGKTAMLTTSGRPYSSTLSQRNHPIAIEMRTNPREYYLCSDVLYYLLRQRPNHACAKSFYGRFNAGYGFTRSSEVVTPARYIVCRRGQPIAYVDSLREYATIMHNYLVQYKWNKP